MSCGSLFTSACSSTESRYLSRTQVKNRRINWQTYLKKKKKLNWNVASSNLGSWIKVRNMGDRIAKNNQKETVPGGRFSYTQENLVMPHPETFVWDHHTDEVISKRLFLQSYRVAKQREELPKSLKCCSSLFLELGKGNSQL